MNGMGKGWGWGGVVGRGLLTGWVGQVINCNFFMLSCKHSPASSTAPSVSFFSTISCISEKSTSRLLPPSAPFGNTTATNLPPAELLGFARLNRVNRSKTLFSVKLSFFFLVTSPFLLVYSQESILSIGGELGLEGFSGTVEVKAVSRIFTGQREEGAVAGKIDGSTNVKELQKRHHVSNA